MKKQNFFQLTLILFILYSTPSLNFFAQYTQYKTTPINIGIKIKFNSNVLNEEREIFISLPQDYKDQEKKYPVLYLLDGDLNFNYTASIVRFLSDFSGKMPETIVIGIPHKDRLKDLSYSKAKFINHICGAKNFFKFIESELIPFIDSNYRTYNYRILFGHSLGAHFTLNTLVRKPEVFNAYFAVGPCFFMNPKLLPFLQNKFENIPSMNQFLYVAKENYLSEEDGKEYEKFKDLLKKAPEGLKWEIQSFNDENHQSIGPISLISALKSLFPDYEIPRELFVNKDANGIIEYLERLSKNYGFKVIHGENTINEIGFIFIGKKDYKRAIEIFKINVENYPKSYNVYDRLAEAYRLYGDKNRAVKNYEKSLKINPKNENAKRRLRELKKKK